jgi:hypothetical protein
MVTRTLSVPKSAPATMAMKWFPSWIELADAALLA